MILKEMIKVISKNIFYALLFTAILWIGSCKNDGPTETKPIHHDGAKAFGAIQVILRGDNQTAGFLGLMYDGPAPANIKWDIVTKDGCLELLVPRIPVCNAHPCGRDSACIENNVCQAYPSAIEVGKLNVKGLKTNQGSSPFTVEHINKYYQLIGMSLAYPPFQEGDTVSISATGSESSSEFTLKAMGFSPLKILSDTIIPYIDDQPIELKWVPPSKDIHSTIQIVIDISFHGGTKAKIVSDCQDNGSLTVPAKMLNQLKTYAISGYPRLNMTRLTKGIDASGKAELTMESTVSMPLEIPGILSCNKDEDCPNSECRDDRRCE
jgi:hypothetical protein